MDHLAILSKSKLLAKILSGEKTIESRWYKSRKTPYMNIAEGDSVYFKESGNPVTAKAKVSKVLFFNGLDEGKIRNILHDYSKQICVPVSFASELLGKKFCTLIFLMDVEAIEQFSIDKSGYGLMAAWITVSDIKVLRKYE